MKCCPSVISIIILAIIASCQSNKNHSLPDSTLNLKTLDNDSIMADSALSFVIKVLKEQGIEIPKTDIIDIDHGSFDSGYIIHQYNFTIDSSMTRTFAWWAFYPRQNKLMNEMTGEELKYDTSKFKFLLP